MKVLEHGMYYEVNRVKTCMCGCRFEYDANDTYVDFGLELTNNLSQHRVYVKCPECGAKIYTNTTYNPDFNKITC